ncbi:8646_t:CDS:2, partial [Ambispora leptoticha]
MSAFPQRDRFPYFPSYEQTGFIEEETKIKPVSCSGGNNCYLIGGMVGQEFSRMEKPTKREWSEDAPRWRVAIGGLNLEGWCRNSSCSAYGGLVVHRWGFKNSGLFSYHDNEHECKCPLCDNYVQPITCGFTNCEWKVSGSKKNYPGDEPRKVDTDWQVALDDGYTTFEDKLTELARWDNLQIRVKFLSSERAQ